MSQQKQILPEEISIEVASPIPLSTKQKQSLKRIFSKALETKINIVEKIDTSLIGGVQVKIASCMIDASLKKKLEQITSFISQPQQMQQKHMTELLQDIKKDENVTPKIENIGRVVSIKDNIVKIEGMRQVKAGELIRFEHNILGIVFNVGFPFCDVILLSSANDLPDGSIACQTGTVLKVPVGKELIGRVVNALGTPIDTKGEMKTKTFMPIESAAPGIIDRQPVYRPFQTGLKVIDALVPIGLGQRELVIGDRQTGKTSVLIDAILNQKTYNKTVSTKDKIYCIYVAIGQKQSSVAQVVRTLQEKGAMDYTCVVCATASDTAAQQYIAPFTATTIAEYFRDRGMHAIVFYDDLSKHANAYRQISLLLRRPPGREAYPGDIFYLHSRLLERAAMISEEKGGGSLTAIPVVETQDGDVSAYIPTNVISITDGQIFLENALFHQGIRPAVNIGLSVSRVGSKAQRPLLAKISASMKLDLSQYREMLSFAQIASDLDTSAQNLLQKGIKLTECLKQSVHAPLCFCDEFLSLYIVSKGFYENVETQNIRSFESAILDYIHEYFPELIDSINDETGKELPRDIQKKLDEAIKEALTSCLVQRDSQ